ncbi:MAG: hypothetical protein RRZ24_11130 [Clostridia bacterium]
MQIPDSFKIAQLTAMCDKLVTLLSTVETTGALGGKTKSPGVPVSTHQCNVQVVSDKLLCEQYGLTIGRDILVTAPTLPIEKGRFIRYGGGDYYVVETPQHDAYKKLLAKAVVV